MMKRILAELSVYALGQLILTAAVAVSLCGVALALGIEIHAWKLLAGSFIAALPRTAWDFYTNVGKWVLVR